MSDPGIPSPPSSAAPDLDEWLAAVRSRVAGMRFGSIQITVHDGRVTQVEATEKTRFAQGAPKTAK